MTELTDLIRTERLALIDLLEFLTESRWQTPSLCSTWTVEHGSLGMGYAAAHLAWAPVCGPLEMVPAALRAGHRTNRLIADTAVRWATRGRPAMLDQLRKNVGSDARALGVPPVAALATLSCTDSTSAFPSDCTATSTPRHFGSSPTGPSPHDGR